MDSGEVVGIDLPPKPLPDSRTYAFTPAQLRGPDGPLTVLMTDTAARLRKHEIRR
jgi:hypothetical protein